MKTTIQRLAQGATRLAAAALAALAAGGAGLARADYVAGWDFKSLAKSQWGTSAGTAIAIEGSAPHTWTDMPDNEHLFTVDFTVDALPEAAGAIVSWKMGNNAEIVFGKTVTTDGSATLYLGWGYWGGGSVGNAYTTYKATSGDYYTWTADAASHTFRVEYDHEDTTGKIRGTKVFMDGVQICHVSGLRFKNSNVKAVVFGGCSGAKGQEIMPDSTATFSDVTYSSGIALTAAATLTSNGYTLNLPSGCVLNADGSISIVGGGLSVEFTDGDGFYSSKVITAEVEASSVPSSGTVIDYLQGTTSDGRHVGLSIKSAKTLAQSWVGSGDGTSWNQGYNDVTYSTPGNKHKVAFAYGYFSGNSSNSDNGGHTYVDGSSACNNRSGLYDSSHNLRKLYVGSLNASSAVALGMRVYGIKLYTTKLDASGAATAATDVIISDGETVEATAGMNGIMYCGSDFTTGFTIDLKGQTVALGTYPGTAGTITVNDSVGGGSASLTIPEGFTGSFAGTGTLAVTAPSSILPSSGGMTLPSTVTIPNASGTVIASDSVTIGKSGIQVTPSPSLSFHTVMLKVEKIPSSECRLVGWMCSTDEPYSSYTGSQFEQRYLNSSGTASGTYGTGAWTRDASEHWLTVAYARVNNENGCSQIYSGTRTYLDGTEKAGSGSLCWSSRSTSKITIGGTSTAATTSPATGMVIKDVIILSNALNTDQVPVVVSALNKGWSVDAAGTTLTSTAFREVPNSATAKVLGSLKVASDGTFSVVSATQAQVLAGGSLNVGTARPEILGIAEGGTLAVTSSLTLNDVILGYTPNAEFTVSGDINGTVTLDGVTVTPAVEGGTMTVTGSPVAANPTYTGSNWWWDYEFNGSGDNTGSDATALKWDSGNGGRPTQTGGSAESLGDYTTAVDGNQAVYLLARPWRDVTSYPSEFTAVMYCKAGTTANAVLVSFGSSTSGSKKVIALTTGDDPSQGQMRLVLIDANSGVQTATDLVQGGFTLDNITTSTHLYAFTVKTVDGNSQITVYADGDLLTTYVATGEITLGTGFQVGSIHGSIQNWMGLSYLVDGSNSTTPDTATMDFLRVSDTALTSEAISALAAEYPYVSPNGIATRVVEASGTWSDSTATPWEQKTLNQDGSSTTTDQAAPNSGTVVDVIATADATLTMNLDSAVTYEKLTFEGAGAITVVKGGTAPTVTTRTYIKTNTTLPVDAFASLGAITVDDGKTLTLIPATTTASTALGLGIRGTTSTIVTGTVTLGNGATVVLDASTVAEYLTYGISLSLEQNASLQYVLTITRLDGDVVITKRPDGAEPATMGGYPLPAIPATIPSDFANSVTIKNNNASEFTVATVFNGGAVPVTVDATSAPVVLTGDSSFGGAVTGTATLTISGDITLASGGSIANTIAGAGTVTLSALSQTLTFGAWTGTVVLPAFTTSSAITLNNYGIPGSTVRVSGSAGWLQKDHANVNPNIELGGDWTLPNFSASFDNTLAKLSGAYKFTLGASSIEYTNDSQTPYFLIKDASDFTGSLETSAAGIVLGAASKPTGREHGGKILVYGDVTVGETATWTAPNGVLLADANATLTVPSGATVPEVATSVANSYAKAAAGESSTVYSVDGYNTVTFAGANMTAERTDNLGSAIKDGDTITFTVTPESGYAVTGVTASSGEVTESNGTYSYTVTGDATITVTTVSAAVTIGDATFEYYAGYAKAKSVTATVSSGTVVEGTTWTLTVGENRYSGTYDSTSGTVTFAPEGGISGISVGSNAYTITASGGSTGRASSTTVAGTETSGWIQEDSDHRETTGAWNDGNGTAIDITYSDGVAALSGTNTYTAAASGNGVVTLTTVVKFGGEADPEVLVGDDAQAAVRIQSDKFEVWGKNAVGGTAGWQTTNVQATEDTTYTVSLTINYTTGTFTASVQASEAGSATPLGGPWYLATAATKISAVAYKGTGEFTSLNGSFVSGDITINVESKNVAVSNEFISQYLGGETVADAAAALNPNATQESNPEAFAAKGNGINYFTCYALGLDPTEDDDKLVVDVSTDASGNFVFTVKHPTFDGEGNIIGYQAINAADNVQATVTYKYGTTVDGNTTSITGDKISPSAMFDGQGGNVLYYKAEVSIGAK